MRCRAETKTPVFIFQPGFCRLNKDIFEMRILHFDSTLVHQKVNRKNCEKCAVALEDNEIVVSFAIPDAWNPLQVR